MKVTYDSKADAMRISFSEDSTSTRTEELGGDFLADYSGNKLISVEILDASKKLPKNNLDRISANLPNFPLA